MTHILRYPQPRGCMLSRRRRRRNRNMPSINECTVPANVRHIKLRVTATAKWSREYSLCLNDSHRYSIQCSISSELAPSVILPSSADVICPIHVRTFRSSLLVFKTIHRSPFIYSFMITIRRHEIASSSCLHHRLSRALGRRPICPSGVDLFPISNNHLFRAFRRIGHSSDSSTRLQCNERF